MFFWNQYIIARCESQCSAAPVSVSSRTFHEKRMHGPLARASRRILSGFVLNTEAGIRDGRIFDLGAFAHFVQFVGTLLEDP